MTRRRKFEYRPLEFALWLSDAKQMALDFFTEEDCPDTVSRIAELIGAIELSKKIVLVQELESLASQVLVLADDLGLKDGLLELYSLDHTTARPALYVKASTANEVLAFLVEKSDKYLLSHTTTVIKEGESLQDAVALLHRINLISDPAHQDVVAANMNHFCACFVDSDRWLLFKRDYYKYKHHQKTGKKTASLNGEAMDLLKRTQAVLGLGNLSDTVLELVKRSGIKI